MIYKKTNKAFSLAEAMIALLIAALILAATMPVITKKHLILPTRGPHGKWACKWVNGQLRSATAASQNSALPAENKWKPGCTFPVLPTNVPYMLIQVIGGGAGGNFDEGLPYLDFIKPDDTFSLPISTEADKEYEMGIPSNALEIPATTVYEVTVSGNKGTTGQLMDNFFKAGLVENGNITILADCEYPGAEPNPTTASVKYKKKYNAGDKLWLETQPDTEIENYQKICPGGRVEGGATVVKADGSVLNIDWFEFKDIVSKPGVNGDRVFLREKEYNKNNIEDLVEIEGSAGGMYVSNYSDDNCRYISCNRYTEKYTRDVGDYKMLVKKSPAGSDIISGGASSYVKAVETTVDLRGGCGGGAGSVNSILMARQKEYANNMQIGKGGLPGKDGGATIFNQVTAKGGTGCSENTSPPVGDNAGTGGQGENATTTYIGDSVGGAGGVGGYNRTAGNGKPGNGLGSGGGGGGAAINMTQAQVENYKETNQEYIKQRTTYGAGGSGASGGVIVSW